MKPNIVNKFEDNNKKPNSHSSAGTKAASGLQTKITTSCPNCGNAMLATVLFLALKKIVHQCCKLQIEKFQKMF